MNRDGLITFLEFLFAKHRRTALIWTGAFALYCVLMTAVFPSFKDAQTVSIDSFPEPMRKAFNIEDLTKLTSFLDMEVFSYAPLVIAFFPIMTLAGAIAGEEERGGLDIYLANPLSRRAVVLANWLVTAIWTLVILAVTGLAIWLTARVMNESISLGTVMRGPLNVFPIATAAGSLALLLSTRMRQKGAVVGIAFGVLFFMYLFDIIGKISTQYESIRWASAFRYYGQALRDGYNGAHIAVLMTASVILLLLSIPSFRRRDIYT